jgi:hypothetical protein
MTGTNLTFCWPKVASYFSSFYSDLFQKQRCLLVLAVNDFGRPALFFNPTHRATGGSALT